MGRNRNHLSPMSLHKAEAKEEVEVEEEAEEEDKVINREMTTNRMVKERDNPSEEDGNPEVEVEKEEEDHLTGARTSENLEWPAKPQIRSRCYNCNEPGHFFRECPLTRGGNGQPQQKAFPGYNVPATSSLFSHGHSPNSPGSHADGSTYCPTAEQCPRNSNDGTHERCDDADARCDSWRQPLLHGDVRNPQRRRTSFKLLEGDDTGTITLLTQGSMPIKVPNYKSFCITHFEAEKIYECLDSDNVVSPMVFNKDFQPPGEEVRPEYQLLEEFLDKGKPMENPYEKYLFSQIEQEEENPIKVDSILPKFKGEKHS